MSQETESVANIINAVSSDVLSRHLKSACSIRRDEGGKGEERMVGYILDVLDEQGIPYTVHEHDAFLSYPRSASLSILSGERYEAKCLTHPFAISAPKGECVGEVTFIADKDFSSALGKIVLVDGMASPIDVLRAGNAGAKALVFANPDWYLHNTIVSTIWGGAPTPGEAHRLPTIPVATISHDDGEEIKRRLVNGPVTVELTTRVETGWHRVKLPEVRIAGRSQSKDFVLVGGHYCSWEYGATDNSTGIAALLEITRLLWQNRNTLDKEVRIAWWPGHSQGRYAGSTWYADSMFEDLAQNCVVYHNIDSPGVRGASEYVLRHTTSEMESFGRSVVHEFTNQVDPAVHRPSRAADQSFLASGVPSCSIYSFLSKDHEDRRSWTGGCAGAWWWHTEHDTIDKVDIKVLTEDTRVSLAFVLRLAATQRHPYEISAMASEIHDYLIEINKVVGDRFDIAGVLVRSSEVLEAAAAVDAWSRAPTSSDEAVNRTLVYASRALNTLVYAGNNRFSHDPADVTPVLGTHKASLFPGLNAALSLPPADSATDTQRFGEAAVRRQVNRYRTQLREVAEYLKAALVE